MFFTTPSLKEYIPAMRLFFVCFVKVVAHHDAVKIRKMNPRRGFRMV